jgi:hypothetical protein
MQRLDRLKHPTTSSGLRSAATLSAPPNILPPLIVEFCNRIGPSRAFAAFPIMSVVGGKADML